MNGTVLIVEDEEPIAAIVRTYLERDGFRVVWAATAAAGLEEFARNPVRLVVLDLGLPDGDGFDVCRAIRRLSVVPIVIVTVRDEEVDRVTGLELGADDYVLKPFSPRELLARVRAVLRRVDLASRSDALALGDVRLDRERREVTAGGAPVELTAIEFELLAHLLERPGQVVSRDRLLSGVWGQRFPGGTRTVDVHVARLRRKLDRPRLIRTVRSAGYKAVAP